MYQIWRSHFQMLCIILLGEVVRSHKLLGFPMHFISLGFLIEANFYSVLKKLCCCVDKGRITPAKDCSGKLTFRAALALGKGEGLTLETSAFQISHVGNWTFFNSLDKTKFLYLLLFDKQMHTPEPGSYCDIFSKLMLVQHWRSIHYLDSIAVVLL